ncbi:MAG: ABC transporter permease [Candidatus Pacebacteria bacterium]|nr:ABC transporter permease [Candidatus Paceibacterota bacterium]
MMKVVYIFWLRQIKKYYRSKSRIIGSLGQPVLFLLALGFGFGPIFQKAGQGNYLQFLAPGVVSMSIIFFSVFSGIEIIFDRQFGFLKETLAAPVSRFSIMLGRTLGGASVATLQGLLVIIIATIAGFRFDVAASLSLLLLFMFLIAVLFTALGTAIGSLMEDFHGFQLVVNFLIMPLFFLSGALFPLEEAPKILTAFAAIDPLAYGVDGLRGSLMQTTHFGLPVDLAVLFCLSAIMIALGAYFFSKAQV